MEGDGMVGCLLGGLGLDGSLCQGGGMTVTAG